MRQKWDIYLYVPRDKDGNIRLPEPERVTPERPLTLEEELRQVDVLAWKLAEAKRPLDPAKLAQLKAHLRSKHAAGASNGPPSSGGTR